MQSKINRYTFYFGHVISVEVHKHRMSMTQCYVCSYTGFSVLVLALIFLGYFFLTIFSLVKSFNNMHEGFI